MTTSGCVRTDLYTWFQVHTVEVTCKQQKWRREREDATKNACGIQTRINFPQQEDKVYLSDIYYESRGGTSDFRLPSSDFLLPTSFFRLPSSDFRLPTSDFRLPTSDFRLPTSDFRLPSSFFRLPTSDFRLPTSDFRFQTSEAIVYKCNVINGIALIPR